MKRLSSRLGLTFVVVNQITDVMDTNGSMYAALTAGTGGLTGETQGAGGRGRMLPVPGTRRIVHPALGISWARCVGVQLGGGALIFK